MGKAQSAESCPENSTTHQSCRFVRSHQSSLLLSLDLRPRALARLSILRLSLQLEHPDLNVSISPLDRFRIPRHQLAAGWWPRAKNKPVWFVASKSCQFEPISVDLLAPLHKAIPRPMRPCRPREHRAAYYVTRNDEFWLTWRATIL